MKKYFCIVLAIGLFAGCSSPSGNGGGTPGSGGTSSAAGIAKLYDKNGNAISSEGITVSAMGTNISTLTDFTGSWKLTGLNSGLYTFSFAKNGFGSVLDFSDSAKANTTASIDTVALTQPQLSDELINFQVFRILDSTPTFYIQAAIPGPYGFGFDMPIRSLVLCISTDSAALAKDPSSAPINTEFVVDPSTIPYAGTHYDGSFRWNSSSAQALQTTSIPHGTKIFAALCVSGKGSDCQYLSNYYDPTLSKQVYTALGPHAQIMTAIMP